MNITCIKCPLGCQLKVEKKGNKITVTGNTCERGAKYGEEEVTNPKRIVTSLIKCKNMIYPCKTKGEVPKDKIFECLEEIGKIKIRTAKIGDVVLKNIAGTGVDVIISGNGNQIN